MSTDISVAYLKRAEARVADLRTGYRQAGVWSGEPLDLVRAAAARRGEQLALVDRTTGPVCYADLDARVDAAAHALAVNGVAAGTPVLLVVGNDVASVVAVHAIMRLDAVVLLLADNAGRAATAEIANRSGAAVGVASTGWIASNADTHLDHLRWIDLGVCASSSSFPPQRVHPRRAADEASFVLFTSGTTSKPKGVVHSLSTLHKASVNYIYGSGLGDRDRIFLLSPLASVTGVVQALFVGPLLAAPVILEDNWEPAATCALLTRWGGTWYGGPDVLLDRMLSEAARQALTVPLRAVYLGGTMLDRRVVERVENGFGIEVMRAYGSTEVPVSTSGLRGDSEQLRHADDGVPLPDVEVRVGSPLDPGECCIRGPHAFLGYVDADDDANALVDGWFWTGDLAVVEGGRLKIVGRIRDIVIRNGLKIPVTEVEEIVNAISGVRQCAGYAVADQHTGERFALAIVVGNGGAPTLADVIAALEQAGLPKYKWPEELVYWAEPLPLNANGKIERTKLDTISVSHPRALAKRLVR